MFKNWKYFFSWLLPARRFVGFLLAGGLLCACFFAEVGKAQNPTVTGKQTRGEPGRTIDSLKLALKTNESDSLRLKTLRLLLISYYRKGDLKTAEEYGIQASDIAEKSGNKRWQGLTLNNLANIYMAQNNFPAALKTHLRSLAIKTQMKDSAGMALSLMNVGIVYNDIGDNDKAMQNYERALAIKLRIGDMEAMGSMYNSIGNVYADKKDFPKAIENYAKALHEKEKDADTSGMALTMGLIANNYDRQGNSEMAMLWYKKSLALQERTGDVHGSAVNLNNMATTYLKTKRFALAKENLSKALVIAKSKNFLDILKQVYFNLSRVNDSTKNYAEALAYYKIYIATRDTIFNEENTKKLVREEMNFEFDKKEALTKADQEKKEAVATAESKKQKMILILVSCVLLLVAIFAFFVYRSFLQKKKTNIEINKQKEIIEEKQKEILDSIHYARRIQTALLPSEKYIARHLLDIKSETS